jgi:putative transposase
VLTEFGHQIAPSTYYAALTRPRSERAVRDEELMQMIDKIYRNNFAVYGARKVWWQLRRDGVDVGRCRVERLMRRMGLAGVVRGKTVRPTVQDKHGVRAADLVKRQFTAGAPNRLWVADFTYGPPPSPRCTPCARACQPGPQHRWPRLRFGRHPRRSRS